ncbi:alpha/beta fold hydrolase [Variovorax sp. YR216]|uniref:alpha/beta fold hydrolase n=1 Tax=Variovorax sp. YR216 TaxID=1882828 RepID=UPI00159F84DB|nr:alpha/beta hydrolase [Variovorax sp. YR216]
MTTPRVPSQYGPNAPAIVLVHDAWSDGSAWGDVISRLQELGLAVSAVQPPLTSLVADVVAVHRAIDAHRGAIVLVGHGWGGAVISQAGDAAAVVALVYLAAYAPDHGESVEDLRRAEGAPAHVDFLRRDSGGLLAFPQDTWPSRIAQDVPIINARVLAAAQRPIQADSLEERLGAAAWHVRPCWFLVAERDRLVPPALQRRMAMRMGARWSSVRSGHALFLSRPRETTAVILEAVDALVGAGP